MSGSLEAEERLDALPYPYVRKPFRRSKLLTVIEDALEQHKHSLPSTPGATPRK